jgi:hypothetical protein
VKLDDCLRSWLKFYENCQELAPEGLYDETVAALEAHAKANKARTKKASESGPGRKSMPDSKKTRIGREKGSLLEVAAKYHVGKTTVSECRKLVRGTRKS